MAEQDHRPDSYRDVFRLAANQGLLPPDLAESLGRAAAMRNLLVHLVERIDYVILRSAIGPAFKDFGAFVVVISERLRS